jgi:hypothetical protein
MALSAQRFMLLDRPNITILEPLRLWKTRNAVRKIKKHNERAREVAPVRKAYVFISLSHWPDSAIAQHIPAIVNASIICADMIPKSPLFLMKNTHVKNHTPIDMRFNNQLPSGMAMFAV